MAPIADPAGSEEDVRAALIMEGRERAAGGAATSQSLRSVGRAVIALVLSGAVAALGSVWYHSSTWRGSLRAADVGRLASKAEEAVPGVVSGAAELERARQKLGIEVDLSDLISTTTLGSDPAMSAPKDASACPQSVVALFDRVTMWSGLGEEMQDVEIRAFKDRFVVALTRACEADPLLATNNSRWFDMAGQILEQQKPVMTKALAASINGAGFDFQVEMRAWMLDESKQLYHRRLGRIPTVPADANITKPVLTRDIEDQIPAFFDSANKWPHCREEILRIHNQGHCGSCWAFSGAQVLDARLCIQSHHLFDGKDAKLSPGYFASCAAQNGFPGNGCQGGWEYFCYIFMDRGGTPGGVSESCNPYFAFGAGEEHFTQSRVAPECPTTCQDGYPRSLWDDGFKLPGVGRYLLVLHPDAAGHAQARRTIYEGGSINFGIFATGHFFSYSGGVYDWCSGLRPNHAVVAYGFFSGGYFSKNSWGESWGNKGLFMVADCIMTDFTAPGNYDSSRSRVPFPLAALQPQ